MKSCNNLFIILLVLIGILCVNICHAASLGKNPDEGVEIFDGISYVVYYKDETLPTRFVTAVTSNKSGDVFVGTKDIGIFRFSKDTSKRQWFYKFPVPDKTEVAVHQMVFDEKNNQLFAATTAGVFRISNEDDFNDASCRMVDKAPARLSLSLALDAGNGLWVGTPTGLYDPSGTLFTSKDGLPSDMVLSLRGDSDGGMWIGTDGGLAVKRVNTFHQVDFKDTDKRWINGLSQEGPLELFIPLEKYQLIARAFFSGMKKNPKYSANKEELDSHLEKMLHVEQSGSRDIIVAASDGLYKVDPKSLSVTKVSEGWFNAVAFANTGQFYALDNEFKIHNFSPMVRLLGKFNLAHRLISKLVGRIMLEITGESEPDFLDEKTIDDLKGNSDEELFEELSAYIKNVRVTEMHFDKDGRMWIATDGGGLYRFNGRLNTANYFVKAIAPRPGKSEKKKRYFLQSGVLPAPEHSDLTEGLASALFLHKKFGYYPLKLWQGQTSQLSDEDWNRTASYLGKQMLPNDSIKFIGLLAVDPWLFIPCVHLDDIPSLKSFDKNGMPDMSDKIISAYENYNLPVVPEDIFKRETYPENHPQSALRPRRNQQ